MAERSSAFRTFDVLRSFYRGVDRVRRWTMNTLFLFIAAFLASWALSDHRPSIPLSTVLVLDPEGAIVEQLTGNPVDRAVARLLGNEVSEVLLEDLVQAVTEARDDRRIQALFLDLDPLLAATLPQLQILRAAIRDFKGGGKPVIASASFYDNDRYYLATSADEIYLHPMGLFLLEGFGRYSSYYKEGLDRFGIEWNVFRVGDYKSAVEPYLETGMSEETKEANLGWLSELWDTYLEDVASARGLSAAQIVERIARFNERLADARGDTARMALAAGFVDQLFYEDRVRARLIEVSGQDEAIGSYNGIGFADYLEAVRRSPPSSGEVAVVLAKGTILPGHHPPGAIGGQSTAEMLRELREDDETQAVVVRIDSPGGSTFASEVIRHELELLREAGKTVVVSMGSYAASGGYWIASAADEIWAHPSTVTGSIGIFSYFPTYQNPLAEYLGIRVDGVGTTSFSGIRPDRELPKEMRTTLQLMIEQGYREFLERVSRGRGMDLEEVDRIAQGQVWTGSQAHDLGLVDHLGGLEDAIAAAAARAGLKEGYGIRRLEKEPSLKEGLMIDLLAKAEGLLHTSSENRRAELGVRARRDILARAMVAKPIESFFLEEIGSVTGSRDPRGLYAHCLCEIE